MPPENPATGAPAARTPAGAGAAAARRSRLTAALRPGNAGVVYALILIVTVLTLLSAQLGRPNYLSATNITNILDQSSLVAILAVFTTVVLISGNFDLSVASVSAFSAATVLSLVSSLGLPLAMAIALGAGLVCGAVNGVIVQRVGINAFIVTLGTMTAVRGLVLIVTDGRTITAKDPEAQQALIALQAGYWTIPHILAVAGVAALVTGAVLALLARRSGGSPLRGAVVAAAGVVLLALSPVLGFELRLSKPTYYLLVIVAITWAVLRYTVIGRRLYAVGSNAEAARLAGINVDRYKIGAFVLNGLGSGFVGVLFAAKLLAINPTGLQGTELTVLAAAILGGTSLFGGLGSVLKSVVGALILFTLDNGFNVLNLGANYQGLIVGTVVIVAAAIYTIAGRQRQVRRVRESQTPQPPQAAPEPEQAGKQEALR
ncbi:D-xylose transport system permease protein [Streptosporangium becharense]|uniref:D-xylose transport system permease protein n=1 Tax=Streptosporangium becharense TaxID=1816182 RepID=A0A7W9IBM1_9ACTN|nr:ABC transporter permease [Streptosporangium becharense]MBB2913648.1 D-xylose transport system permease protein [Streptosporangium becharense]MBB5817729.1 D-xylose transport system permease protein [Streptosporangium becharense]